MMNDISKREPTPVVNKPFPMTINKYQQLALQLAAPNRTPEEKLTEGFMGLCGESGECVDILKKYLYQGHALDVEDAAIELGDVAWYLALSADALGYDLETIFRMNLDKINKRYPNGFNDEASRSRKDIPKEESSQLRWNHSDTTPLGKVEKVDMDGDCITIYLVKDKPTLKEQIESINYESKKLQHQININKLFKKFIDDATR